MLASATSAKVRRQLYPEPVGSHTCLGWIGTLWSEARLLMLVTGSLITTPGTNADGSGAT